MPKKNFRINKNAFRVIFVVYDETIAYMYTVIYYMIYCTRDCAALHQS